LELEEDPPQPARIADTKRQEDAEKRMKGFITKKYRAILGYATATEY
jgi:hypothetical protein